MKATSTGLGLTVLLWAITACASSTAGNPTSKRDTPLGAGSAAPDVAGSDQNGSTVRLRDLRGHPVLVFFYPKAGTPGCTREACAFRDVWQRYEAAGIRIVGVSHDSVPDQAAFAKEHGLRFPLVSDTDGKWGAAFGVPLHIWKFYSRMSFLIDRDGKIAKTYLDVDPGVHASQVLADARTL